MILTKILSTWRDTLKFLKWSEFKLILLVSLKSSIDAIKLLIKYFWWLLIIRSIPWLSGTASLALLLSGITSYVLFYAMILALRPSLERKNFQYFINYAGHLPGLFVTGIVFVLCVIIPLMIALYGGSAIIFKMHWIIKLVSALIMGIVLVMAGISSVLPSLFFLDSEGRFADVWRSFKLGIKIGVYFAPLFFIPLIFISTLVSIPAYIIAFIFAKLPFVLPPVIVMVCTLLALIGSYIFGIFYWAVFINYYTKIKHTYSKLIY